MNVSVFVTQIACYGRPM